MLDTHHFKDFVLLAQDGEAVGDLVGGQVFDVGGDGPLVSVGVCNSGEAVAVELVGGFGDGGGAGRHRLAQFSYKYFPAKSSQFGTCRPTKLDKIKNLHDSDRDGSVTGHWIAASPKEDPISRR